jgi:peptidoglycan hydrolase-like protein with peptidoglycan-binding domain
VNDTLTSPSSLARDTIHPTSIAIAQAPPAAQPSAATPKPTPADSQGVLKLDDQGAKVAEVQTLLKQLGYYDGPVDGFFGDRTQVAVSDFQKKMGLPVDGQVKASTFERIEQAIANKAPADDSSTNAVDSENTEATAANESPAPEAANAETNAPRKGWLWWTLVLLLAASTLAGVFLYELRRSNKKGLSIKKPPVRPTPDQPLTPTPEPVKPSYTNGSSVTSSSLVLDKDSGSHTDYSTKPSETTLLSETTRLPKVNIADELVRDFHHPDPGKRRKAIWDLGQHGNSEAIQPLVDLMMDSDSTQRSLILAAISEIGIRTLKPMNRALLISLQDRSSDVRKNAIRDVTRIYDQISQVSQLLAHAASDPDSEVQETARWALGQLNRIRGLPEGTIASLPDLPKAADQLPNGSPTQGQLPDNLS